MNVELAEELVDQLGSALEHQEAQQAALFQFLKDQGVVTDDQLAPYLSQAGKSSGVRWRGIRIRLDSLISAEKAKVEDTAEKEKRRTSAGGEQAPNQNREKDGSEKQEREKQGEDEQWQSSPTGKKPDQKKDQITKNEADSGKVAPQQQQTGTNMVVQTDTSQPTPEKKEEVKSGV